MRLISKPYRVSNEVFDVKQVFFGNSILTITSMLYEQNKSIETIQRQKSDTAVHPIPMVEITIVRLFLSS